MTKLRTIAAVAIAAGTFGGTVGALATAAVQSQASPQAVAAAVQRVSDSNAEKTLRAINTKLQSEATVLSIVERYLSQVCSNTAPSYDAFCSPAG